MGWSVRIHVWLRCVHDRDFTRLPARLRSDSRLLQSIDAVMWVARVERMGFFLPAVDAMPSRSMSMQVVRDVGLAVG